MGPRAGTGSLRGAYATWARGSASRTRRHRGSHELAARGSPRSRLNDDVGHRAQRALSFLGFCVEQLTLRETSACPSYLPSSTLPFSILGRKVWRPSGLGQPHARLSKSPQREIQPWIQPVRKGSCSQQRRARGLGLAYGPQRVGAQFPRWHELVARTCALAHMPLR